MLNLYLIDTSYSKNELNDLTKISCLIFDKKNFSTSLLTIHYNNSIIKVSCDCDYTPPKKGIIKKIFLFFKKEECEFDDCIHIKWLTLSYFDTSFVSKWTLRKINNFKLFNTPSFTPNGHNIECSICLDTINYDTENTYYCKVCKNSVHNKCWNKFVIMNSNCCKLNCCICRTGILRNFIL